jgi:molecular chaperone GrpE
MNHVEPEEEAATVEQPAEPAKDPSEVAAAPAEKSVSELEEQLARALAHAAEYRDGWLRAVADLSNARKRMTREQAEFSATASARVLEKIVPIIDDVDRAFSNVPPDQAESEWVAGFRLIQRKLQAFLDSEGVTSIPTAGRTFDPALDHAVSHEEADGYAEGQIIAEVARGYRLGDRVLRPAMVRVARGK